MEMKTNVRLVGVWRVIIISVIVSLIYACSCPDRKILSLSDITPSEHTLLAITPDFSLKVLGDTLNKKLSEVENRKGISDNRCFVCRW